jgi:hypothetical protein
MSLYSMMNRREFLKAEVYRRPRIRRKSKMPFLEKVNCYFVFGLMLAAWPTLSLAEDDLSKPIKVSPDGHFLTQPDGKPFFWLADTAWELLGRLNREETDAYLKDRAAKGYNVILVIAPGLVVASGQAVSVGEEFPANRYGETPFLGSDPMRPNPRYFEHVGWMIDRAAHYGIRVALLPLWSQAYVSGTNDALRLFGKAEAEAYGRWLGERYRNKGIIWVLGGDVTPLSGAATIADEPPVVIDYRPVYDALAKGILAGEGGDPFITYHPTVISYLGSSPPRTSLYFANRPWLDMNMIQSGHGDDGTGALGGGDGGAYGFIWKATFNYVPVNDEYRSLPTRPIIDAEPSYEDHPIWVGGVAHGFWQSRHIRGALYHALFAGAAGHTYGNTSIWDFHDPNGPKPSPGQMDVHDADYKRGFWLQALNAPGAGQMRHAKNLMLSRPYFTRIPDQSLIGGEAGEGSRHIGATRSRDGSYAMVYIPDGRPVTVDLTKIAGSTATGWWFDPRTGKARRIEGDLPTNQAQTFTPPTSGEDQDWVLVIDDKARNFGELGGTK